MHKDIPGTVYFNDIHFGHRMVCNYDYWHPNSHALNALSYMSQNKDCKNDHGERTNHKLKDQPFFQRGRNGKMKTY